MSADDVPQLTRAERGDLAKVARMRARVAKADVAAREAELAAQLEAELSAVYPAKDPRWADLKEAADAAAKGSFGMTLGVSPDMAGGAVGYRGAKVSKLTATSRPPASVVLDVWMVNPARCDALLSSEYQDAGAAYVDGYWVVLMGQRVAPSPAAVPAGK